MCTLTLTAGLCLIIASFGIPGLAAQPPNPCYGRRDGLYPNPDDPTTFYICGHGIPYHQHYPGNLVFDPNVEICDISTTNPNHCVGRTDGRYPKAGDPKRFYQCLDQKTLLGTCPGILVFRECCSCCGWPAPTTTTTPNPTTTTPLTTTTTTTTTTTPITTTTPSTTTISSPTTTTETPTTITTAPSTTTTSPHTTTTPTTTTTTPTTTTPTTSSSGNGCLKPNGVFAHPKNPRAFLNCANGIAYVQPCHGTSVFKQECNTCVDIAVQC